MAGAHQSFQRLERAARGGAGCLRGNRGKHATEQPIPSVTSNPNYPYPQLPYAGPDEGYRSAVLLSDGTLPTIPRLFFGPLPCEGDAFVTEVWLCLNV